MQKYKSNQFPVGDRTLTVDEQKEVTKGYYERSKLEQDNIRKITENEIKDNEEYNKSLFEITDYVKAIELSGPRFLIRLFKFPKVTESGLILPQFQQVETEGGRKKVEENKFDYTTRGVVVNISPECTDGFKSRIKVGDIVDVTNNFAMIAQSSKRLDRMNPKSNTIENYFLLNETAVDWKVPNI